MELTTAMGAASEPSLPSGWGSPESFEEVVRVGSLTIALHGFVARHESGKTATGSAASINASPARRAAFELCERIALIDASTQQGQAIQIRSEAGDVVDEAKTEDVFPLAPQSARWSYAMSNGVALHTDWGEACRRAELEAAERDAVLRSWFGGTKPAETVVPRSPILENLATFYELHPVTFESRGPEVVFGVFGFPRSSEHPLLMGFGAGRSREEAWQRCEAEALQRTGFLWGEAIPEETPLLAKNAVSQQEYYLFPKHHQFLRAWLDGEYEQGQLHQGQRERATRFADLTSPAFSGTYSIVKAIDPDDLPLVFGQGHPHSPGSSAASQRVQPIG